MKFMVVTLVSFTLLHSPSLAPPHGHLESSRSGGGWFHAALFSACAVVIGGTLAFGLFEQQGPMHQEGTFTKYYDSEAARGTRFGNAGPLAENETLVVHLGALDREENRLSAPVYHVEVRLYGDKPKYGHHPYDGQSKVFPNPGYIVIAKSEALRCAPGSKKGDEVDVDQEITFTASEIEELLRLTKVEEPKLDIVLLPGVPENTFSDRRLTFHWLNKWNHVFKLGAEFRGRRGDKMGSIEYSIRVEKTQDR